MNDVRPVLAALCLLGAACSHTATSPASHNGSPPSSAPAGGASAGQLDALLEEHWQWRLRQNPFFATVIGDPRYNDRVQDRAPEAVAARKAYEAEALRRFEAIDRTGLAPARALDAELFHWDLALAVDQSRFCEECLAINQLQGPQTEVLQWAQRMPRQHRKDWEDLLSRLHAFPRFVDQTVALLDAGLKQGITPPRIVLRDLGTLVGNAVTEDPRRSPIFLAAFSKFPSEVSEADREALRARGIDALRSEVFPALRSLQRYAVGTYVPRARMPVAFSSLPDGAAWYRLRVRQSTTTHLDPDEIHRIGLAEVQRIRGEMEGVMRASGFRGSLPDYLRFLKTDKRFFWSSKEEMLVHYRDIAKRIDPELPRLFGRLPRLPYGVEAVPEATERSQPAAYYERGSAVAGRAGVFFVNTYDLGSRPKWDMEDLVLHEGVPGHHFQISIASELTDLPPFRRFGGYTAYVEGWGLYAESLGSELGMYADPTSHFGQLSGEIWRAIRLVVDTGMHAKGWSRQQAIDYFRTNSGLGEQDIVVEVDRYLAWPGQALAYKMGELRIQALRSRAQAVLGTRFDLRAFHDEVLGQGALPLDVLEARMNAWIEAKKPAG